jgi:hypothetical protein
LGTTGGPKPSLWSLGGLCLAVTCGGFALFLWLAVPDAGAVGVLAGGFGFGAPTTALAIAGLAARRYRRQWTDEEWIAVTQAFRSLRPPAGTELDERLLMTISRRRVLLRRVRRYGPWIYGVLLVVALGDLIAEPAAGSVTGLIGTSALLGYSVLVLPSLHLRRLDRLEAAITERRPARGRKRRTG